MQVFIHAYTHTCMHTPTHTRTHKHTLHTHTHTHTHSVPAGRDRQVALPGVPPDGGREDPRGVQRHGLVPRP